MGRAPSAIVACLAAGSLAASVGVGASAAAAPRSPASRAVGVAHVPSWAVRVDQAGRGAGSAVHPLRIGVMGEDERGPILALDAPAGYSPAQIAHVLGLTGDGTGQTIAIVVAYHDPKIEADVNAFSQQFGLPKTCDSVPPGTPCFDFTQLAQSKPKTDEGWALEASLNVEWAHAIAPKASIVLSEAKNSSIKKLFAALDKAAGRPGVVVISNSWYTNEFGNEDSWDPHCALKNAVCVFATGDGGNPGSYPAFGPNVIAAGGTTLDLDSQGNVLSETAWSCSNHGDCNKYGGTGGGLSKFEPRPSYQVGVNPNSKRGTPDVSFDSDPLTGVAVYDSFGYKGRSGWFVVGGTSVAPPAWAAIVAVADQLRSAVGKPPLSGKHLLAQSDLYAITSGLFDVTQGKNGNCGSECTAKAGYDFVTGLGSPRPGIDTALKNAA